MKAITKVKGKEVITTIRLPSNFIDVAIPVGYAIKYFGTRGKKSTDSALNVFVNQGIEPFFTISSEKVEPLVYIERYFQDDLITVEEFEHWCNNKGEKKAVWIKANIFSGDSPRQVMLANDAFLGQETLEFWSDKPLSFIESCPAVVYCDVYQDKIGKWKGNVICLYIDDKYKVPKIKSVSTEIAEEKKEQENLEDETRW